LDKDNCNSGKHPINDNNEMNKQTSNTKKYSTLKSTKRKVSKHGSIRKIFIEKSDQHPHPNKNEVWDY
jgi:hypothetical protein